MHRRKILSTIRVLTISNYYNKEREGECLTRSEFLRYESILLSSASSASSSSDAMSMGETNKAANAGGSSRSLSLLFSASFFGDAF